MVKLAGAVQEIGDDSTMKESQEMLKQAVAIEPNHAEAYLLLGKI